MMEALPPGYVALGKLEQAIRTFGNRYARRMIIRRSFGEFHPVVLIEDDLVSMAKSQLQERILAISSSIPESLRADVVASLRKVAQDRIAASDEDEDTKSDMMTSVASEDFADVFFALH